MLVTLHVDTVLGINGIGSLKEQPAEQKLKHGTIIKKKKKTPIYECDLTVQTKGVKSCIPVF